jgi:hypothetical protein
MDPREINHRYFAHAQGQDAGKSDRYRGEAFE